MQPIAAFVGILVFQPQCPSLNKILPPAPLWLLVVAQAELILNVVAAANLILFAHLLLAAVSAWYLARTMGAGRCASCVAGLVYGLSGASLVSVAAS